MPAMVTTFFFMRSSAPAVLPLVSMNSVTSSGTDSMVTASIACAHAVVGQAEVSGGQVRHRRVAAFHRRADADEIRAGAKHCLIGVEQRSSRASPAALQHQQHPRTRLTCQLRAHRRLDLAASAGRRRTRSSVPGSAVVLRLRKRLVDERDRAVVLAAHELQAGERDRGGFSLRARSRARLGTPQSHRRDDSAPRAIAPARKCDEVFQLRGRRDGPRRFERLQRRHVIADRDVHEAGANRAPRPQRPVPPSAVPAR